VSEMPIGGVRDCSGAFVVSVSFRTTETYRAHRAVSFRSRNDALSGCIVTNINCIYINFYIHIYIYIYIYIQSVR